MYREKPERGYDDSKPVTAKCCRALLPSDKVNVNYIATSTILMAPAHWRGNVCRAAKWDGKGEITRCVKRLRNKESVIEATNKHYSALFRIALIDSFYDAFSIPQSFSAPCDFTLRAAADKISVTVTLNVNLNRWANHYTALDLRTLMEIEIAVNLSIRRISTD